jgi:RNA polymerase sigma-B factor
MSGTAFPVSDLQPDGHRGLTRAERSARTAALFDELGWCSTEERRKEILDEVVLLNRGVAESVASRYRDRGLSRDDLNQVAYLGLVKAAARFDPETRNDFLTFAVPTIRGEVLRHFRDSGWAVRPPRRVQELQWHVNQTIRELEQDLGREPKDSEIIAAAGTTYEEYTEAVKAFGCFTPTSLDQPAGVDSDAGIGDLIPDERPDQEAAEARTVLAPVVRRLPERDRRILKLRFLDDMTQAEIGADLGVTQMQVSRLLGRIMDDLRDELGDIEA